MALLRRDLQELKACYDVMCFQTRVRRSSGESPLDEACNLIRTKASDLSVSSAVAFLVTESLGQRHHRAHGLGQGSPPGLCRIIDVLQSELADYWSQARGTLVKCETMTQVERKEWQADVTDRVLFSNMWEPYPELRNEIRYRNLCAIEEGLKTAPWRSKALSPSSVDLASPMDSLFSQFCCESKVGMRVRELQWNLRLIGTTSAPYALTKSMIAREETLGVGSSELASTFLKLYKKAYKDWYKQAFRRSLEHVRHSIGAVVSKVLSLLKPTLVGSAPQVPEVSGELEKLLSEEIKSLHTRFLVESAPEPLPLGEANVLGHCRWYGPPTPNQHLAAFDKITPRLEMKASDITAARQSLKEALSPVESSLQDSVLRVYKVSWLRQLKSLSNLASLVDVVSGFWSNVAKIPNMLVKDPTACLESISRLLPNPGGEALGCEQVHDLVKKFVKSNKNRKLGLPTLSFLACWTVHSSLLAQSLGPRVAQS